MSEQPKTALRAYMVSLLWENGVGHLGAYIAAKAHEATAMAATTVLIKGVEQPEGVVLPDGRLATIMAHEMPLEWLRWAVLSIERGEPQNGEVLHLVRPAAVEPEPGPAA
jgi:hypothetical protein